MFMSVHIAEVVVVSLNIRRAFKRIRTACAAEVSPEVP